jgi:hypothetical protein
MNTKPGYKTTEFWMGLLAMFLPVAVSGVPPKYQALVPAIVSSAYAVSRGLAKGGVKKADVVADAINSLAAGGGVAVAPIDSVKVTKKAE